MNLHYCLKTSNRSDQGKVTHASKRLDMDNIQIAKMWTFKPLVWRRYETTKIALSE
jgi:hypothetical protein